MLARLGILVLVAVAASCVESEFEPPPPINNVPVNNTPIPTGARVGESCDAQTRCRQGLQCEDGVCAFVGGQGDGEPCQLTGDCALGLYCDAVTSLCSGAGSADVGEECGVESDCLPGLRCAPRGFSGECVSTGQGDIGSVCESSSDCYAGLNCATNPIAPDEGQVCLAGLIGLPQPWAGVECEEDAGPFRAYFEVPGSEPLSDFFRLPYPNDIRLSAGRPDLTGFPTPGDGILGYDLVQRYVDAVESRQNGFGLSPAVQFRFSGSPNFDTLTASGDARTVHLINVDVTSPEYGRRRGLRWAANTGRTRYMCANQMMIRSNWGDPLLPNTTYAFMITRGVRSAEGQALQRDDDFAAMLQATRPEGRLGAAWDAHAKLRDWLADSEAEPPAADDLFFASVVTTGDPLSAVEALAAEAREADVELSSATLCTSGASSPCEFGEARRACGDSQDFFEVHGTLNLPSFQEGNAPFEAAGGAATPGIKRREDVCVAMTIPKTDVPEAGWPVLIVAHGTGGNFKGHVGDIGPAVNSIAIDGETINFVTIGWDQVLHGSRRGGSERHPNELVFNYENPAAAQGNFLQGAAEIAAIISFVEGLEISAEDSPTGEEIKLDAENIWFFGHSQGGTTGPLALPFETRVKGSIFSGAGAGLTLALMGKTSPVNSPAAVRFVLQEPSASANHPVLNMLQGYFDPVDPHNFARRMTTRAIPDRTYRQHVFQTIGVGDTFTPPDALQTMAVALQVTMAEPFPEPFDGVSTAPAPLGENSGGYTVVGRQYVPSGYDGHFVIFRDANAQGDLKEFLGTGVLSGIPEIR